MTAPLASATQQRLGLWGPRLIVAFTVAALVLVGLDAGGPLRSVTTALAVLVAPGLAASLAMGPMSLEARALVSVVASASLLTVVSMVLALLGSSSPTTGLWVSALVAFALILVPFLRSGRGGAPTPVSDHDDEGGNGE
ncbi:hypothetical protein [Ilumatobacter sp.]|uniref:hypothetical protein n=1 Tax=Ilumatobacter sp. TaxID=1967498 RepID=UPI003AF4ABC8